MLGRFNISYIYLYLCMCVFCPLLSSFYKNVYFDFTPQEPLVRHIFILLWIKKNKSFLDKIYFWSWDYIATWKMLFFIEEKLKRFIRTGSQLIKIKKCLTSLPVLIAFSRQSLSQHCSNDLQLGPSQLLGRFSTVLCLSVSLEHLHFGSK